MGFLDSVKKATGVGLNAAERYHLAFEKGVLLGKEQYAVAIDHFEKAAALAAEENNEALRVRSLANSRLYRFISTGDARLLPELKELLSVLDEIEQIGSQSQLAPAGPLRSEIEARIVEFQIEDLAQAEHGQLSEVHEQVSQFFRPLFTTSLITYKWQSRDRHVETGQPRFFYHQAFSMWHRAHYLASTNPESAAESMAKAVNAFKQCGEQELAANAQAWLQNARTRRTCWMCHREVQGSGLHFSTYSARVTPYMVSRVEALGQDTSSIDNAKGEVVLCVICGTLVENSAERIASKKVDAIRTEFNQQISTLTQQIRGMAMRKPS